MKLVVLTGASRGIGASLLKKFLREQYFVITISRSKIKEQKQHKHFVIDIENIKNVNTIIEFLEQNNLKISVLINNAGYLINKPFVDLNEKDFLKSYKINCLGPALLIQNLYNCFEKKSHILNISTMGAFQGSEKFPGLSAYSSSKAALTVLTESLALELKEQDISVNCLCLGAVQTEMLEEAFPGYKAPLSSDEMAEYIYRFANEAHHVMNGKIIPLSLSTP